VIALSRWIICDDPVEAMLALVAMGVGLYAAISRFWLIGELKRRGVKMSVLFSTSFFYLEYQYLKHRKAIGDLRLDWIVLSSFLAPAVFVLLLVAHFRFWPMPQ